MKAVKKRTQRSSQSNLNKGRASKTSGMGEVRIIGGDFRGRKLPVLDGEGLRPTSDRVRETLFNWLQFDLAGGVFLDAFSGSGALGMEALSRGAQRVVFLEKSPKVAAQLTANLHTLGVTDRAEVVCTDSLNWLQQPTKEVFDGVFLDPPFGQNLLEPSLEALQDFAWLSSQAWCYLEQEKSLIWPKLPEKWSWYKDKTTSQVRFGLLRVTTSS